MSSTKPSPAISFTLITLLALPAFVPAADLPAPAVLRAQVQQFIQPLPDKMPGVENDTPERVQLGRDEFFDERL